MYERNLMVYKVSVSFCSFVCFQRCRCRHNLFANNLFTYHILKIKVGSATSYGPLASCKKFILKLRPCRKKKKVQTGFWILDYQIRFNIQRIYTCFQATKTSL